MAGPSGGALALKNNFEATVPPSLTDDISAGYAPGSSWLVLGTGEMWRCRTAAAGAARWVKIDTADHPGYVPGLFYQPFGQGAPTGGGTLANATIYLGFGVIKSRTAISQLGARVSTVSAGGNFQLGLYAHNASTGKPSLRVGNTGSGSTASATTVNAAVTGGPIIVEPGNYWFALQSDNTTAQFLSQGLTSGNHGALVGSASNALGVSMNQQLCGLSTSAGTFGTWPDDISGATFTELLGTGRAPLMQFLVQAVP
ncbi:hypothetical protein FHR71_001731 [Methylobacterium sp. RAS18]|nr:hypothetical protein [Methylobacterium sp. RAS18]